MADLKALSEKMAKLKKRRYKRNMKDERNGLKSCLSEKERVCEWCIVGENLSASHTSNTQIVLKTL